MSESSPSPRPAILLVGLGVVLALVGLAAALMLRFASAPISPATLGCHDTPEAQVDGIATPMTCADSGFRPQENGFTFANWPGTAPGDAISVDTMVALFGRSEVCVDPDQDVCTPIPEAVQWARDLNALLANGRCEGMSVAAERFYTGLAQVGSVDPRAQDVHELARANPRLVADIDYWWATQVLPEVAEAASASRSLPPSRIVKDIVQGLRDGASNTLGIYSAVGAHSLTPFAVTFEDPTYSVWVYDANHPGQAGRILIDPSAETWEYQADPSSPAAPGNRWRGEGAGGLEYTPMTVRMQDFAAPFGSGSDAVFASFMAGSLDSSDRVDLIVSTQGRTVDSRTVVNDGSGLTVTHVDDDGIGNATVAYVDKPGSVSVVPVSSEAVRVRVTVDGPSIPWQDVTLIAQRVGPLPITIEVSPDFGTRYRLTESTTADVTYLTHDGTTVHRTIAGPGELTVPLLSQLPSASS